MQLYRFALANSIESPDALFEQIRVKWQIKQNQVMRELKITTLGAIEGRVVSQVPIPGTVLEGGDRTVRLRFEPQSMRRPNVASLRREEG